MPVALSAQVSLRCSPSSVSRPSFPHAVPCSGAALCSAGSLGSVPQRLRSYCGTPTSRSTTSLTLSARSVVPSPDGGHGISQVPRRPSPHMPRSTTPVESTQAGLRGFAPTSCSLDVVFRPVRIVDFHNKTDFGVLFRGLRARCLRFVSVVAFRSRKTRFRLAALPCRTGLQPAGSLT